MTQIPNHPKLVFFGTPNFVLPVLDAMKKAQYDIVAVVTQPPKPVGRKQTPTPSSVALWAKKHGVPIFDASPRRLVEPLKKLYAGAGVLEAYGRILPPEILALFPHGIINVHPSLLPKYRGASPIEAALVAGDLQTGVTIIKLDEEVDHGPILAQFTEPVLPNDTKVTLRKRLFEKAAVVLVTILPAYLEGRIELREQDHPQATFTTLLKKEYGFIPPHYLAAALRGESLNEQWPIPFIKDYNLPPTPYTLERFIRALTPWPGAYTNITLKTKNGEEEKRLKILTAHLEPNTHNLKPTLRPDLVQLEGKTPVSWDQFQRGYPKATF